MSETHEPIGEVEIGEITENLKGDYVTAICDRFRHAPKTWQEMSEDEQKSYIAGLSEHAENLIRQVVRTVAKNGRTVIEARLEKVTVKDGIKGEVSVSQFNPDRHALFDSVGDAIMVVVAGSAEDYDGGDMPQPDPDQPDMIDNASSDLGEQQPEFPEDETEAA